MYQEEPESGESQKVRVTIESLDEQTEPNRDRDVMAEIRQRQKARNHQPSTATEVEEYLRQECDSWE